ncbi:hypothetical protein Tco_0803385 [Tanacetum coccineum]|uniref:Reverse transcriptase domain-containing protein n=1 Tax=Tanacetum coccineum TaxID=301880 RepID=A0ABQ5A5I3_9ASTR
MTNRRERTPPPGFSTPPQIPNNTTSERPPMTTTVFAATTPENTPFAYHASTSANPNPMISPAFVEANYEILESLLRERRRQIRNEDLRTELEYFSEDYDEEREMEPRPEPHREATPTLRPRSPVVRRQRERVVGFEEAPNREGSRRGRNAEGTRPSKIEAREGSFADSTSSAAPFVRWIEDYPLLNKLKIPSHIGSYDGKGDLDNFLHLFERAIHMQKWPSSGHTSVSKMNSQRHTWRFTISSKEKAKVPGSSLPDTLMILYRFWVYTKNNASLGKDRFSPYRGPNHGLLSNLSKSPREILATEKAAKSFEQPPRMFGSRRSQDMSKYCHFHEDHGHDTNDFHQLRNQIEEAVKSVQLSHRVKGIKKEKEKTSENQRTEGKKDKSTAPVEAPILMIRQDESYINNKFESLTFEGKEIMFPSGDSNSSAPVVIKAKLFGREVNRVASKIDSKVPLVGFSGEKSWSIRKIPLEITIGDAPLTRKETLDFVIVKSDSPYNMLLGRTTMQRMGIVVSTIHGAIKFHTAEGICIVFSTYESDKVKEGVKKVRKIPPVSEKGVFSCTTAEEKVIISNKYPEQIVTIRKHLPKHFKRRLRDLLKANADVFAWTHADMTRIPRTIMVKGKPFNTEHK